MPAKVASPIQALEQLKDAASQARRPHEREAWLNLAFYLGQQYTEWNDRADTLKEIPRHENMQYAPRPVANKVMHFVQQTLAEVLRDQPQPDVLPPTDDLSDIEDANVARAYLSHVAEPVVANYDAQLESATLNAIVCGQAYLKWAWNASEKRPEIIPVPFFEGFPDPYAKDWTQWRYFIHSQFMDTEQVYELFNVEVGAQQREQADMTKTALMRGMGSTTSLSGVTVNEAWFKPSRRYPKGRYAVWAGGRFLVEPTEHPYTHQRLPFTLIGTLKRPDSQFFQSAVEFLRPAQMELNQYHAQRISNRKDMANPKWWIPEELQLDADPTDAPGQILRGSGGSSMLKPEIIQPAAMADNGDGEMLAGEMMNIVGLHEVSQAQVPGRVEAAKAIELLKESDGNRTGTLRKTMSQGLAAGGFQILELARQFESTEKMVAVYSREAVPEIKKFRAGKMAAGFRVRTTQTTGLARSRSAKQDLLFKLIELGVLRDPELIAEQLDMPLPQMVNHAAADVRLARNENIDLAKGTAVVPSSWDDHVVHLREHNTYRKTREYQLLPTETKQKLEHHCQTHETMQLAQLQKAAALQAAALPPVPGAPPPAGANPAAPPVPGAPA